MGSAQVVPPTPAKAEEETRMLWNQYRQARDQDLPREAYDLLEKRVRAVRRRYKGLPDCSVSYQQLQDLSNYIKLYRPTR